MRLLVAEDDRASGRILESLLTRWDYQVELHRAGLGAWESLRAPDGPQLALLDWMMPGMDGVDICHRVRALEDGRPRYLIMLTAMDRKENVVAALRAGADDYLTKPFSPEELRARVEVGERVLALQSALQARVSELQAALEHVKLLQGLLPICSYCKRIRRDDDYWQQIEGYITDHSEAKFTHGICPACYQEQVEPELERFRSDMAARQRLSITGETDAP